MDLRITNFKITLKVYIVSTNILEKIPYHFENKKNFIFKFNNIKCTLYHSNIKKRKLNATGIKNILEIKNLILYLKNFNIYVKTFHVDNTTCSLNFFKTIDLDKTSFNIYNNNKKFSYNKEKFSGLFYYKQFKNEGTSLIFKNGKIIILGCNKFIQIKKKCQDLIKIVHFV